MIVLPVWAMICLCLPHVALPVLFIIAGIVGLWDQREAYKAKLRAEFEAELSPIERAFRSGEEAVVRKNNISEEADKSAEESDNVEILFEKEYAPVCPRGYDDCIWDPARIKHNNPDWYKRLYGDLTPEEAIRVPNGCMDRFNRDPNEDYYCWDDEEK